MGYVPEIILTVNGCPSGEMDTSESRRDSGVMKKWAMSLNPCQMVSSVIICIILTVNGCRRVVVKINKKIKILN